MSRRHVLLLMLAVATCANATADDSRTKMRIIGYLPGYRVNTFRQEQAAKLTDLVLFSVAPRADGSLDRSRLSDELIKSALRTSRGTNVRTHVTVGGWGKSSSFADVAATPALRNRCIRELRELCDRFGLSGVDVDWEHPADEQEHAAYAVFLKELQQSLAADDRILSVAVAPWKPLSDEAMAAVDRIHLMAYDNGGRHSTLALAFDAVDSLLQRGVPPRKICLGIPFYGRPFEGEFGAATTYAKIVESNPRLRPRDNETDGLFFNGPDLVARKVRLAGRLDLCGVMIWEIGQDAADDERSLLRTVHKTITQTVETTP